MLYHAVIKEYLKSNCQRSVKKTNGDAITGYALSGALPPGLSFDAAAGVINGTPAAAGTFSLSVTAKDKDGVSNADGFVVLVGSAPPTNTPPTITNP